MLQQLSDKQAAMEQKLTELLQKNTAAAAATSYELKEMKKATKPAPFKGERDAEMVESFIWSLQQHLKLTKLKDGEAVQYAATLLTDKALLDWRILMDASSKDSVIPDSIRTIDAFEQHLRNRYLPTDYFQTLLLRLEALKMKKGHATLYTSRFNELTAKLELPEHAKIHFYMRGLASGMKQKLAGVRYEDCADLIQAAERMDGAISSSSSADLIQSTERTDGATSFSSSEGSHSSEMDVEMNATEAKAEMGASASRSECNRSSATVTCDNCGKRGHLLRDCRSQTRNPEARIDDNGEERSRRGRWRRRKQT